MHFREDCERRCFATLTIQNGQHRLYVRRRQKFASMPIIVFFYSVMAVQSPCCHITLDYVEVMHDEGELDYITVVACLMAVYFIYYVQNALNVISIQFIQYHLAHMNERMQQ